MVDKILLGKFRILQEKIFRIIYMYEIQAFKEFIQNHMIYFEIILIIKYNYFQIKGRRLDSLLNQFWKFLL